MSELFSGSVYFGVTVSLAAYGVGVLAKRRWRFANPLLIAVAVTIAVLAALHIDYDSYYQGAKYLSYLLTPATVSLAIPLYEQLPLLKRHSRAIALGVSAGVLTSLTTVLALSALFGLDHRMYVTLLPKSITTAIGMGVSEKLGGYVTITVAVIIITGIFGNIIAGAVCRLFRVTEPVARGVAIGSASHAIGTARAMEMGEIEGAMSSLSLAVSGVLTVFAASVYAQLLP